MSSTIPRTFLLGAATATLAVVACAGSASRQAKPTYTGAAPDAAAEAAMPRPGEARWEDDIAVLYGEIREWRAAEGLTREPSPWEREQASSLLVADAKKICPVHAYPKTAKCQDMCSLSENICDNAENICRIANDNLPDNTWARDKCDAAKASCKDAKKRCCDCNGDEPHEEAAPAEETD